MLRASNQEPPGRHMTRENQWGATVQLLVRPRKVGVTQKGHSRDRRAESATKRTWRFHMLSSTRYTGRPHAEASGTIRK